MKRVRFRYKDKIYDGFLEGTQTIRYKDNSKVVELPINEAALLAPVTPSKIIAVGLNYKNHAEELGMELPLEPLIFLKPATSLIGPGQTIIYPEQVGQVDYEAELAIIIGKKARNVSEDQVLDCIEGFTCFNDVTARDLQKKDVQWTRAKSFDTFAPIGPCVTKEIDPDNVIVRSYVNGQLKQEASTKEFIFKIPRLISFISGIMTLLPGDVIATGTPPGVGPLKLEDEVTIEIEGIGRLTNRVMQD